MDSRPAEVIFQLDGDRLCLRLEGDWRLQAAHPEFAGFIMQLNQGAKISGVMFNSDELGHWDSALVSYLAGLVKLCRERQLGVDDTGLPDGIRRLLKLAFSAPTHKAAGKKDSLPGYLHQIGVSVRSLWLGAPTALHFIGDIVLSVVQILRGRASFSRRDLALIIQEAGPQALPVVSLISFLVGLILAYMGAVQLQRFGAQIYIADLVGIGMVREVGALMTGVIMAGRTGAAYAAQLGSMQVNEEIDAFRTLGISPVDYLVAPRVLGLVLMLPLLTLYSGLAGILAGMLVSLLVYDVSMFEYYEQTVRALDLRHFFVGMSKGLVYGIVIALAGCFRGLQCGRSTAAVGIATTSAVVTSIVFIVITASVMTIVFQQLGI